MADFTPNKQSNNGDQSLQNAPPTKSNKPSGGDEFDIDINELIEKIKTDQTAMIITIVIGFVLLLIIALICTALCSFVCSKGDREDRLKGAKKMEEDNNGGGVQQKDVTPGEGTTPFYGQQRVKSFVIQEEKDRIVQDVRRRLRMQVYSQEVESPLSNLRGSHTGLIQDAAATGIKGCCQLCKEFLRVGENTFVTSCCKKMFHQQCLFTHILKDVEKKLKVEHEKTMCGQFADLDKCGAQCPGCGLEMLNTPLVEEQEAIEQLGNVLGLLSQSQVDIHTMRDIEKQEVIKSSRVFNNDTPSQHTKRNSQRQEA